MKRSAVLAAVVVCLATASASYASAPAQPTDVDTRAFGLNVTSSAQVFFPVLSLRPVSPWSFTHATMVTGATLQGSDIAPDHGMRVAIDPITGELRQPGADDLPFQEPEQERMTRSFTATEVQLPDGTVMMPLDPELMNFSLGWTTEEGARFTCIEGHAHAASNVPAALPAREEK